MRRRLSYANVTATLALVLSLGGASYAAIELPRHSVGAAQLKPRSVGQRALAVPIAAEAKVDESVHTLTGTSTPECPPQPEGAPPCIVRPAAPPEETLRVLRINASAAGLLLVSAVANAGVSAGDDDGRIELWAELDSARLPGTFIAEAPLNGIGQASYSGSAPVSKGKHVLRLKAAVTSFDTQVAVSPLSLHATVLPRRGPR